MTAWPRTMSLLLPVQCMWSVAERWSVSRAELDSPRLRLHRLRRGPPATALDPELAPVGVNGLTVTKPTRSSADISLGAEAGLGTGTLIQRVLMSVGEVHRRAAEAWCREPSRRYAAPGVVGGSPRHRGSSGRRLRASAVHGLPGRDARLRRGCRRAHRGA